MVVGMAEIVKKAKAGGYAVGSFNFKEYSDMRALADAAVMKRSPVIMMSTSGVVKFNGARSLAYAFRGICEELGVPCALHLDHASDFELIKECVMSGYTSVMIDASHLPFNENIEATRRVVDIAKERGVSVEAELGTIGGKEDGASGKKIEFVDPSAVREFIERTGVDALAVAIGTIHGIYKEEPNLRFDLIQTSAACTDTPLVMHGGSGLTEGDFKRAIKCGISKVNVGTELKMAFVKSLIETSGKPGADKLDPMDYLRDARERCRDIAAGKMEIFGCAGKA